MAKFNAPADRIVAYYAACIAAIRDALPMPLVFELDGALAELTHAARASRVVHADPGLTAVSH